MTSESAPADPVDAYLDRLLGELRGDAHEIRRILTEIEAHLRDGIDAGVAEGLAPAEAAERALARCGSPATVARRFAAAQPARLFSMSLIRPLVMAAMLLGAIGLISIGVSGGVAQAMGSASSARFIAGDPPTFVNPPARCNYYLEYYPQGHTCSGAAAIHHFGEVVTYRLAAGVLGLMVLAVYLWRRRRDRERAVAGANVLPEAFVATIGATVFTATGVFLIAFAIDQWTLTGSAGAGQYLSGGVVAVPVGIGFGVVLLRTLSRRAAQAVPAG